MTTDNDNLIADDTRNVIGITLPMSASELERRIRTHCEHHGVWDDCMVVCEKCGHKEGKK